MHHLTVSGVVLLCCDSQFGYAFGHSRHHNVWMQLAGLHVARMQPQHAVRPHAHPAPSCVLTHPWPVTPFPQRLLAARHERGSASASAPASTLLGRALAGMRTVGVRTPAWAFARRQHPLTLCTVACLGADSLRGWHQRSMALCLRCWRSSLRSGGSVMKTPCGRSKCPPPTCRHLLPHRQRYAHEGCGAGLPVGLLTVWCARVRRLCGCSTLPASQSCHGDVGCALCAARRGKTRPRRRPGRCSASHACTGTLCNTAPAPCRDWLAPWWG